MEKREKEEKEGKEEEREQKERLSLFIHKYKPIYFEDYRVNCKTMRVIKELLEMDVLNLILCGESASGKTTILNTIIHEYYRNCTHSEKTDNILYIHNLKEQGIQFYRNDVKQFCQTRSNIRGKKKMLIIDDIDYINEQSQQVFRNCIEKYSKNVFFIVSCTIIQKVIDNIQSHLQNIQLQPFLQTELKLFVDYIQEKEHLKIDDDAKDFILSLSENSIQLLIHHLEKFYILNEHISLQKAKELCSNISFYIFDEYIDIVLNNDLINAIQYINSVFDKGYSCIDIFYCLFYYIKYTPKLTEIQKYNTIQLLCKYITVFYYTHEDKIELGFFTNRFLHLLHHSSVS